MSALVVPSKAFKRLVNPRRENPLAPPRPADAANDFASAKQKWGAARDHWQGGWSRRKDARVELENAVDALFESNDLPAALNLDLFAAAERVLHGSASIIALVSARFGALAALRVKVRSLDWVVASGREKQTWWWMLQEAKATVPHMVDAGWRAVRNACCLADSSSYAEARDAAETIRLMQPEIVKRVPIDFAFPNEESWSANDMRAILVSPDFAKLTYLSAPLFASLTDEDVCTQFLRKAGGRQAIATLRHSCDVIAAMPAPAATRVLLLQTEVALSAKHYDETELTKLACALTSIESEAMARGLAKYVRHARFERYVASYFEEHGTLARGALADAASGKSLMADAARHLLQGHDRASAPDGTGVLALDDAPRVLRDVGWMRRAPRRVLALERLPWFETIAWAEGEKETIAATPAVTGQRSHVRPIDDTELAEFDALPEAQKYVDVWPRWNNKQWTLLELPDDRRLDLWSRGKARLYHRPPCFMLACYGAQTLDGLYARDPFEAFDDRVFVTCLRVDSPRSALVCARASGRRRTWRKRAKAWLCDHSEAAAIGLIPIALGRESRARRATLKALRYLAHERPEIVREVAGRYGDTARDVVVDLVFGDPLMRIDARGQPPGWVRIDALPVVATRDGRPLPRAMVRTLVDILRARGNDVPYAGIAMLREELDQRSLADLSWALFMTWILHGRKRVHEWMAQSLAAFANEDTVVRLAPYAREWAHADPRACITLVDVFAAIGTEPATLELVAIADAARAPILIEAVTEALGPRGEPVAYLGLDERGEATLDLGSRTVRVVLDESLVPRVVTDAGRRLPQVPRANKNDDPKLAALAARRFNRLRREAEIVAKTGLRRLERDMLDGHRVGLTELETRFVHHPLLRHAARRLVWESFADRETVTFRIVDDGSYASDRDLPVTLDVGAEIGLVHPINLDEAALLRWGTLFADYELLQPFEQLGRITFMSSAAEAAEILKALQGVTVEARALLSTLDAHGWARVAGRRTSSAWRDIRSGVRASLVYRPGVFLDKVREAPPQKLGPITLNVDLATLTRIELSELVRTAHTLRG